MMNTSPVSPALFASAALLLSLAANAQEPTPAPEPAPADAVAAPAAEADTTPAPAPETVPTIPVNAGAEPAPAKEATHLDTVEVTGSRIKRTDYETAAPVAVIKREDIDRTGLTSIGDLLQKLPAAGTALGTSVNNGGTGAVEVDLRNLTSARVLVLVNGHRWVNGLNSTSTSAVDLTTIPISIIERVEVLKDGASAIYGSDAIAGVINIVTRKNYSGAELHSQVGAYQGKDGLTQSHNLTIGNVLDKTSMYMDLSFTRQDAILNSARRLTQEPTFGTGNSRGSGGTPQGHFQFVPTPQTASGLTAVDPDSCSGAPLCNVTVVDGGTGANFTEFRHFDPVNDPYNYAPVNYLLTPNERTGVYAQIGHALTPDVNLHSELLYTLRRSSQNLAPMPILAGDLGPPPFNTLYISVTNIYNHLGQDIGKGANGPLTPGSGLARNRSLLYGNRVFHEDVDTLRGGFSADGNLDLGNLGWNRLLSWDVGYSYAESKQEQTTAGLYNLTNFAKAIGPATDCTGNCVPFNMFGANITPDMLAYVSYTGVGSTRAVRRDLYANASTELLDFFGNGPVGFAFGFERREETYANIPDPLVVAGQSSNNRAKPTEGGYNVNEVYSELSIPALRNLSIGDIPVVEEMDFSLAGRFSDYARFGKAKTGKVGMRYKPYSDLLVRSTYSSAFRAPNLGELYLGNSDSFPGVTDWCDSTVATTQSLQNCQSDGVPPTYVNLTGQSLQVLSGNPNLQSEPAHTLTAGLVYSPSYVQDLNLYLDYYRITAKNFISVKDPQGIFDHCYLPAPSERYDCEYIDREPTSGVVQQIRTPFLNLSRVVTSGIDFNADYRLPWQDLGMFKVALDTTYLLQYDQYNPLNGGQEVLDPNFTAGRHATLAAAFPKLKANLTTDWSQGDWSASYSLRYISAMTESCVDGIGASFDATGNEDGTGNTLRNLGLCSKPTPVVRQDDPTTPNVNEAIDDTSENVLKTMFYHSVQVSYTVQQWATQVTFGVNNLLDTDPPPSYATSTIYTFEPTQYDIPGGRFPYIRVGKTF